MQIYQEEGEVHYRSDGKTHSQVEKTYMEIMNLNVDDNVDETEQLGERKLPADDGKSHC